MYITFLGKPTLLHTRKPAPAGWALPTAQHMRTGRDLPALLRAPATSETLRGDKEVLWSWFDNLESCNIMPYIYIWHQTSRPLGDDSSHQPTFQSLHSEGIKGYTIHPNIPMAMFNDSASFGWPVSPLCPRAAKTLLKPMPFLPVRSAWLQCHHMAGESPN